MATTWPTSSGKKIFAALRRRGWEIVEINREATDAVMGPMSVRLRFGRDSIVQPDEVGRQGERFQFTPKDVK